MKRTQNNAVKRRKFDSLTGQNHFLIEWERTIADTRIHGTTRQQVGKCFELVERPALQPLPTSLFPVFEEGKRSVHLVGSFELNVTVTTFYLAPDT